MPTISPPETIIKQLPENFGSGKLLLGIIILALILGVGSAYFFAVKNSPSSLGSTSQPTAASQDTKTFRDFAEGVIQPKPSPKDPSAYTEGTNLLIRQGADPVTLTSSVVDLSKYIGKKVKVFGETQQSVQSGWLMDVGKVQVE